VEAAKTTAEATTQVAGDTIPPTTTALPSPIPNAAGWNNSIVTVNLMTVDNPGGSGVRQITYSVSGAQVTLPTTGLGVTASVPIGVEGVSTVTFFATDNAGNVEAAKTLTVRIDVSSPSITAIRSPGRWLAILDEFRNWLLRAA
jgi:hypothetical protein